MGLSRDKILELFNKWLAAWDKYDLEGVMAFIHEDIVFENWDGKIISGKNDLQRSWTTWFVFHGKFKFISEDVFIDEQQQKMTFQWRLEWPSLEKHFKGQHETRRGADVIHFMDGKISKKYSYSQTIIQIDSRAVPLYAS